MKKRLTSLALTLALLCTLVLPATAHDMGKPGRANKISTGTWHSGYVDEKGSLWMWGNGEFGQLGTGKSDRNYIEHKPVKIMDDVICVSANEYWDDMLSFFTAAVKSDGSLWMWGSYDDRLLGDDSGGDTTGVMSGNIQNVPMKLMDNVTTVSCGLLCAGAIKTDGSLWVWGELAPALAGGGSITPLTTPVKVMDDVVAVSCGDVCAAAIKTDGSLWMWGTPALRSLNGRDSLRNAPVKVMDDVAAVSCGGMHAAAVKTDGSLWTWGWDDHGQLGIGGQGDVTDSYGDVSFQSTPVKIMDNVASVSCGFGNTAVIKTDGSLWTWGWNEAGQVGNGGVGDGALPGAWPGLSQSTPVKVLDNVSAVSCDWGRMIATKTDGSLWQWGVTLDPTNPTADDGIIFLSRPTQVAVNGQRPVSPSIKFSDVPTDAFYADAVKWAVDRGITSGTSSTTFSPNSTCTVAQILTFLYRANGSPQVNTSNPFVDVKPSDYYYNAALWAYQKGLVSGSVFGPNAPCTRSMIVTYLWKLAGSPYVAPTEIPTTSSLNYAPYTLSGTDCFTDKHFSLQFDAVMIKKTTVRLYNDGLYDDDVYYEYDEVGKSHDVTLIAVRPESQYAITGGFWGYDPGEEDGMWINGIPCLWIGSLCEDGTLRYGHGGRGYTDEEHVLYPDTLSIARGGGYVLGRDFYGGDCYALIGVNGEEYFVAYADAAVSAGLLQSDGSTFSDVPSGVSYARAVAWAVEKGITSGTSKTTFSPDGVCTRGQIVTFLYRAFGK